MRNMMNVREIFDLRKQGKIEEAYEAIRPIYREHKGRFTTLCMFWTASDVFKLRLEQGRVEEAEKIFKAMLRILPSVEEYEQADDKPQVGEPCTGMHDQAQPEAKKHSAAKFLHYAEGRLIKASEKFRRRYFAVKRAKDKAEEATVPAGSPAGSLNTGQQTVFDCIKAHPGQSVPGIESDTSIPAKSIERHIKVLIERNLIEHRGSKKTGGYHAL